MVNTNTIHSMDFSIHVDVEEITRYSSGKIISPIYIKFDSVAFPDDLWDDFTVVILGWWIEAVQKILTGTSDKEELCFMDGDFEIELSSANKENFKATCIENGKPLSVYFIKKNQLIKELLKATKKIIEKCLDEKWLSDDLNNLMTLHKRFEQKVETSFE